MRASPRLARLLPIGAALASGGCASMRVDAPSLAPRAVEQRAVPLPDEASEPAGVVDPALAARLDEIVGSAEAGHRAFRGAYRAAARASESAGARQAGGEAWIAAQQALSALDAARAPLGDAAAALDALRIDEAHAGAADRGAIDAAAARIDALQAEEAAALATIAGRVG